ncbi:MAG: NfeD family protein [Pseudomonadota bacterium]
MPWNLLLFGFLTGISPWWWIAAAMVLGIFEVVTATTYLLGPAAAAGTVGVILLLVPELSGTWQVTIFAIAILVYTMIAWVVAKRLKQGDDSAAGTLNRRGYDLIGREAAAEASFAAGIGRVVIDGVGWRARLDGVPSAMPDAGARMRIVGVDGATLVVEAL